MMTGEDAEEHEEPMKTEMHHLVEGGRRGAKSAHQQITSASSRQGSATR